MFRRSGAVYAPEGGDLFQWMMYQRLILTSSSSMESVTVTIRVLAW